MGSGYHGRGRSGVDINGTDGLLPTGVVTGVNADPVVDSMLIVWGGAECAFLCEGQASIQFSFFRDIDEPGSCCSLHPVIL